MQVHVHLAANVVFVCLVNLLFTVTCNVISVMYVTEHRCAGGLKKKLNLRSGSHTIDISLGSLICPSKHRHGATLLRLFRGTAPFQSPFTTRMGIRRTFSRHTPQGPHGGLAANKLKVFLKVLSVISRSYCRRRKEVMLCSLFCTVRLSDLFPFPKHVIRWTDEICFF